MTKKRNGLLELYRLFFCFWVLYFHHFLFIENTGKVYRDAYLAVEFFFILGGVFLLNSLKRTEDLPAWQGCGKFIWGRLRPLFPTLCVVFCFNVTGIIIQASKYGFDFDTQIGTVYYLWFLPFLFLGLFCMYWLYRCIKNKTAFFITLAVLTVVGYTVEFSIHFTQYWLDQLHLSIARSLGGVSFGILLSRIPRMSLKWKKINFNYPVIIATIALILWTAYKPQNNWQCASIIVMYGFLIYFTLNIQNVGGKFFDFIGALSMRLYIYMAILCMLLLFGVTDYVELFFINLTLSLTDMFVFGWLRKRLSQKKKA